MRKLSFELKVFISLVVLCIAGIVFSIVAIDKQIDAYIDELKTEIQIVNNTDNNVVVEQEDGKVVITINSEETEEVAEKNMEQTYGMVTSMSGLNIRQNPSVESTKIGVLEYGAKVKILEDCGDWYRTENGYIFKDYILKI